MTPLEVTLGNAVLLTVAVVIVLTYGRIFVAWWRERRAERELATLLAGHQGLPTEGQRARADAILRAIREPRGEA